MPDANRALLRQVGNNRQVIWSLCILCTENKTTNDSFSVVWNQQTGEMHVPYITSEEHWSGLTQTGKGKKLDVTFMGFLRNFSDKISQTEENNLDFLSTRDFSPTLISRNMRLNQRFCLIVDGSPYIYIYILNVVLPISINFIWSGTKRNVDLLLVCF